MSNSRARPVSEPRRRRRRSGTRLAVRAVAARHPWVCAGAPHLHAVWRRAGCDAGFGSDTGCGLRSRPVRERPGARITRPRGARGGPVWREDRCGAGERAGVSNVHFQQGLVQHIQEGELRRDLDPGCRSTCCPLRRNWRYCEPAGSVSHRTACWYSRRTTRVRPGSTGSARLQEQLMTGLGLTLGHGELHFLSREQNAGLLELAGLSAPHCGSEQLAAVPARHVRASAGMTARRHDVSRRDPRLQRGAGHRRQPPASRRVPGTTPDPELIVVDDGSRDLTCEIVRDLPGALPVPAPGQERTQSGQGILDQARDHGVSRRLRAVHGRRPGLPRLRASSRS